VRMQEDHFRQSRVPIMHGCAVGEPSAAMKIRSIKFQSDQSGSNKSSSMRL
jgi:hypothetical protein